MVITSKDWQNFNIASYKSVTFMQDFCKTVQVKYCPQSLQITSTFQNFSWSSSADVYWLIERSLILECPNLLHNRFFRGWLKQGVVCWVLEVPQLILPWKFFFNLDVSIWFKKKKFRFCLLTWQHTKQRAAKVMDFDLMIGVCLVVDSSECIVSVGSQVERVYLHSW